MQTIFLRGREVEKLTGLKPAARDRAIRAGLFPRPFLIGVKQKAWSHEELLAWVAERDAARAHYADPAVPTPLTDAERSARYDAAARGAA